MTLSANLLQAGGGWLSDRKGACRVMYWTFPVAVSCTLLLSYPNAPYAVKGIHSGIGFRQAPGVVPFIMLVFVPGFFMSPGKAAVYKPIPVYNPTPAGGMVSPTGGRGGVSLPIAFGALNDLIGLWTSASCCRSYWSSVHRCGYILRYGEWNAGSSRTSNTSPPCRKLWRRKSDCDRIHTTYRDPSDRHGDASPSAIIVLARVLISPGGGEPGHPSPYENRHGRSGKDWRSMQGDQHVTAPVHPPYAANSVHKQRGRRVLRATPSEGPRP